MSRSRVSETPESYFEALYAENYARVLGYVLRRAPTAVAADVVAEVFLVAWRRLDQVPQEALPWLLGVARKTLANERRGWRRRAALADALAENSGAELRARAVDEEEGLQALGDAVARLGEIDRDLLRLIAWDGLTTREAARVLGISYAACRVRLHRLRRRLVRDLDQSDPETTSSGSVVHLAAREET